MLNAGDTFWIADLGDDTVGHLWVIISEPDVDPDRVAVAAFTTWEDYKDDSCILEAGDHPFIRHTTCIDYRGPGSLLSAADIEQRIQRGQIKLREPVGRDVLARIREGAARSKFLPMDYDQLLREQGLIE